jgi:hypothetical protein
MQGAPLLSRGRRWLGYLWRPLHSCGSSNSCLKAMKTMMSMSYRRSEFWPSVGQLRGAHRKHIHLCLADDEAGVLEEPADLVLNIPLDLDEQSPADKKGFDRVTVEIFNADLLVPSTLHDACNAHGVVTIALVDLQLQSRLRVPGIDADDGQPQLIQLGP